MQRAASAISSSETSGLLSRHSMTNMHRAAVAPSPVLCVILDSSLNAGSRWCPQNSILTVCMMFLGIGGPARNPEYPAGPAPVRLRVRTNNFTFRQNRVACQRQTVDASVSFPRGSIRRIGGGGGGGWGVFFFFFFFVFVCR